MSRSYFVPPPGKVLMNALTAPKDFDEFVEQHLDANVDALFRGEKERFDAFSFPWGATSSLFEHIFQNWPEDAPDYVVRMPSVRTSFSMSQELIAIARKEPKKVLSAPAVLTFPNLAPGIEELSWLALCAARETGLSCEPVVSAFLLTPGLNGELRATLSAAPTFVLCLEGSVEVEKDGKAYELTPGDVFFGARTEALTCVSEEGAGLLTISLPAHREARFFELFFETVMEHRVDLREPLPRFPGSLVDVTNPQHRDWIRDVAGIYATVPELISNPEILLSFTEQLRSFAILDFQFPIRETTRIEAAKPEDVIAQDPLRIIGVVPGPGSQSRAVLAEFYPHRKRQMPVEHEILRAVLDRSVFQVGELIDEGYALADLQHAIRVASDSRFVRQIG